MRLHLDLTILIRFIAVIFCFTEFAASQSTVALLFHKNATSVNAQLTSVSPRTDFLTANSSLRRVAISSQFSSSLSPDSAQSPQLIWQPFDLPTIGVQVAGSVIFGGIPLLYVSTAHQSLCEGMKCDQIVILYYLLAGVGQASGVYFGGEWMKGNGSFWWTLAGVGAAYVGSVITAASFNYSSNAIIPIVIIQLAVPIIIYHLSADTRFAPSSIESSLSPNLQHVRSPLLRDQCSISLMTFTF